MSCGCASPDTVRTRAGMCAACPHGEREGGQTVACTVKGKRLGEFLRVKSETCYRWPGADGTVRWGGLGWIGVPDPLRWLLAVRIGREPQVGGCGCVRAVKESWWAWLLGWLALSGVARRYATPVLSETWADLRDRL